MYYLYELINSLGTIEYVGVSKKPVHRFQEHKSKPGIGRGKFYRRQDIFLNIIENFDNKFEALEKEYSLQKYWGLKTDRDSRRFKMPQEGRDKISEANRRRKKNPSKN